MAREDTKNQGISSDGKEGRDLGVKALHKCGMKVGTDMEMSR